MPASFRRDGSSACRPMRSGSTPAAPAPLTAFAFGNVLGHHQANFSEPRPSIAAFRPRGKAHPRRQLSGERVGDPRHARDGSRDRRSLDKTVRLLSESQLTGGADEPGTGVVLPILLLSAIRAEPADAQQRRAAPNVLLIQADDLGYGDLSAYGQARFQTPSLDRLAREGIRFTQYYAGSTVCAPSRAALMTGLHTGHAWIRGNGEIALRPRGRHDREVLRDAGYRTAVIGKWGLGAPGTHRPARSAGIRLRVRLPRSSARAPAVHRSSLAQRRARRHRRRARLRERSVHARDARRSSSATIARPFFVYLNYTVPHAELRVPDDSLAPFRGKFPGEAVREPDGRRAADRREPGRRIARLPIAARAACGVRRDDHAHGSRHRPPRRSPSRARPRSATR